MTTTTRTHRATSRHPLVRAAAFTTATALAANMAVFGLARVRGVNFQFPQPGSGTRVQTVGVTQVAVVTLLAMIVGWALVGLADRRQRPTLTTIARIGGVVAVMSMVAPLSLDADLSVTLTLASLHLTTGALYVAAVTWLHNAKTEATR